MLVGALLLSASLVQATPPFTETFGPGGEVKTISDTFVSCEGRTQVQASNAMADLIMADTDAEAKYALRLNKCNFVANSPGVETIRKVIDKKCVQEIRTPDSHYCKFEYYLFELQSQSGKRFFAIYSPVYD